MKEAFKIGELIRECSEVVKNLLEFGVGSGKVVFEAFGYGLSNSLILIKDCANSLFQCFISIMKSFVNLFFQLLVSLMKHCIRLLLTD